MKTMHCNFAPLFSSYPSIFAKIHFRLFQVLQLSCKVAKKDEKSEIGVKGLNSFYGVRKKENCIYHNISQKTHYFYTPENPGLPIVFLDLESKKELPYVVIEYIVKDFTKFFGDFLLKINSADGVARHFGVPAFDI